MLYLQHFSISAFLLIVTPERQILGWQLIPMGDFLGTGLQRLSKEG